jgi:hypothetical protein
MRVGAAGLYGDGMDSSLKHSAKNFSCHYDVIMS